MSRGGAADAGSASSAKLIRSCPVGCAGDLVETAILLPEGALRRCQVCGQLVSQITVEAFDRSIDVHVSRIRAAIEDDAKKPRRILTVRGAGYVFAKAQD